MAVHALNALCGNLNRDGGVWALPDSDYIDWPQAETDETAASGLQQPRLDGAGSGAFVHAKSLLTRLPKTLNTGEGYPLEVLFVSGANPLYTVPDTAETLEALERIPLVVSLTPYMDDTAAHADLILPGHAFLERYEDLPTPAGFNQPLISLAKPVVPPLHDTRHPGDTVIALARALGGTVSEAFPWEDYQACLEETLGDRWDQLAETGFAVEEVFGPQAWEGAFTTASGKFEFSNRKNKSQPASVPLPAEGEASYSPLLLIPYDVMRIAGGAVGNPPFLTKTIEATVLKGDDGFVQINPETAKTYGLKQGAAVKLTTPRGEARARVHLFEGIMPEVVALPRGLGRGAEDAFLAGKGVNVNQLIGPLEDPASGFDAAWGIRVKLAKA
jgi:anaerobic selenocysteine-containing dehydrogenase